MESFTESAPHYSEQEREKWRIGGEQYRELEQILGKFNISLSKSERGQLKALFLGEKPAIFMFPGQRDIGSFMSYFKLKQVGKYIYDREQVQVAVETYPDIFSRLGTTAEEVMENLSKALHNEEDTARGLILGFPLDSVRGYERSHSLRINQVVFELSNMFEKTSPEYDFIMKNFYRGEFGNVLELQAFIHTQLEEKAKELGLKLEDIPNLMSELEFLVSRRHVGIEGFNWVDYGESKESKYKQERIRAAFETSGLLA